MFKVGKPIEPGSWNWDQWVFIKPFISRGYPDKAQENPDGMKYREYIYNKIIEDDKQPFKSVLTLPQHFFLNCPQSPWLPRDQLDKLKAPISLMQIPSDQSGPFI